MSTTGDGNLAPGGQEGLAGVAEAQAGARDGVDRSSEPRRGDSMPEAEAGGVVGASGGQREAALEGGNAEEESDIGPAEEEEEEEQAEGVNRVVDSRHFPMTGFRLTFLNLMHSMLNRLHNNHVLVRPNDDHVLVWHQTRPRSSNHGSATVAEFSDVPVPSETAECQDENSKEEAQATKSEGKEKKYNKKQEEPEKDPDPAKDRPRKSSVSPNTGLEKDRYEEWGGFSVSPNTEKDRCGEWGGE
ncbi:hypothetical protein MJG53_020061 [Ovis ammon polii x Ovis aries]|uniref:Uncharacterized protein n=1 Tax=Ovis ammon polii x Ovis aries TaxID=2918886 RepID=A0ACB9U1N2_9CETA|nr:hypothetical protein MJG53_020061 [Ovis ammon polii x Ovis aries]